MMVLTMYSLLCFLLVLIQPSISILPPSSRPTHSLRHASILNQQDVLQDIVTWDSSSIMIRGERLMFLSAEFHPWRLPSPGLWLDVFQKVKALGFSGVSFYLNWALLEGEPGFVSLYSKSGVKLVATSRPLHKNANCIL